MSGVLPPGRSVRFTKGYDKRGTPERYGVHGMEITFYLRGEEGIVQFKMGTDWIPWEPAPTPDPMFGSSYKQQNTIPECFPSAYDLGYHSHMPMYEGALDYKCTLMESGRCYYDGSGLNAESVLVALIYEGEEAVWQKLTDYYQRIFRAAAVTA